MYGIPIEWYKFNFFELKNGMFWKPKLENNFFAYSCKNSKVGKFNNLHCPKVF